MEFHEAAFIDIDFSGLTALDGVSGMVGIGLKSEGQIRYWPEFSDNWFSNYGYICINYEPASIDSAEHIGRQILRAVNWNQDSTGPLMARNFAGYQSGDYTPVYPDPESYEVADYFTIWVNLDCPWWPEGTTWEDLAFYDQSVGLSGPVKATMGRALRISDYDGIGAPYIKAEGNLADMALTTRRKELDPSLTSVAKTSPAQWRRKVGVTEYVTPIIYS